jgi:hypothetical protein
MVAAHCPYCGTAVAVDSSRSRHRQHCHNCGRRLRRLQKKKRLLQPEGSPAAEVLFEKQGTERVWLPFAGGVLVFVLAAVFALWMFLKPETKPAAEEAIPPAESAAISAVVTKFLAARTAEEWLPLIRDPDKFAPAVRAWGAENSGAFPLGGTILRVTTKQAAGSRLAESAVRFDQRPPVSVLTVFTPDGWRIDWRAWSGTGDLSVPDFIAQKPAAPALVLAVARLSDYYNGTFASSADWICLHLTDNSGVPFLYAYVPRNDAAMAGRIARLSFPRTSQPAEIQRVSKSMALRLHVPATSSSGPVQAVVDSIEGEGWFIP